MKWHKDALNWHGPIDREEQTELWDWVKQALVPTVFEYRLCGCITTREAAA